MKTHKVLALVKYSMVNELPREFYAHEIPILQRVNGGHPLTVVNPNYAPGEETTARDVLISLRKAYGSKVSANGGGSIVDEVFPDGSRDIEAFYRGDYVPEAVSDEIAVLDDGDVFPPRKTAVAEPVTLPSGEMDRDTAIAKLRQLGVPFSVNTPTKHLIALLESSVESGEVTPGLEAE